VLTCEYALLCCAVVRRAVRAPAARVAAAAATCLAGGTPWTLWSSEWAYPQTSLRTTPAGCCLNTFLTCVPASPVVVDLVTCCCCFALLLSLLTLLLLW
jgi:hypothetical protein